MKVFTIVFILSIFLFFQPVQAQIDTLFEDPSDFELSKIWKNALAMEAIDLTKLKEECNKEKTLKSNLNLELGTELKAIFGAKNYAYGLIPKSYESHSEKLLKISKKAQENALHYTALRALQYVQFTYEYGLETDKQIASCQQGIAYYNTLSESIQQGIKNKEYILSQFYYNLMSVNIYAGNFEEAMKYRSKAFYWSERLYESPHPDIVWYVRPMQDLSEYFIYTGQFDSASYYIKKAITATQKEKRADMLLSLYFTEMSINMTAENYKAALQTSLNIYEIAEKEEWYSEQLLALSATSEIHRLLGNTEKAINFSQQICVAYSKNKQIPQHMLSNILEQFVHVYKYQENWDSAAFYGEKMLKANQQVRAFEQVFNTHLNLKDIYQKLEDSIKANYHFDQASQLVLPLQKRSRNIGTALQNLGDYCLLKSDYKKAISHFRQALDITTELNLIADQYSTVNRLCKAYITTNQIDSVEKYFNLLRTLNEEYIQLMQDSTIADMQTKYETQKKEQQIRELGLQNKLSAQRLRFYISLFIFALIVISLVIYLYYRQRKTSTQLRQLQQTKDQLFSIIAHDLRTPFNALIGFSDKLKVDLKNKKIEHIRSSIDSIQASSRNAYFLFENLLGWTKAQTRELAFVPKDINLQTAIQNSFGILEGIIQFKNIKIETALQVNGIHVDNYMFETILRNLLTNALKFSKDNGQLKIISEKRDEMVYIAIEDNGKGMDQATLQRILEQGKHQQQGLGMRLCKEFVTKNGGQLGIESTLGQGTLAWFTLPIAKNINNLQSNSNPILLLQQDAIELSIQSKKLIAPLLIQLQETEVFYATQIYRLLDQLPKDSTSDLQAWIDGIDRSIQNIDNEQYLFLLTSAKI